MLYVPPFLLKTFDTLLRKKSSFMYYVIFLMFKLNFCCRFVQLCVSYYFVGVAFFTRILLLLSQKDSKQNINRQKIHSKFVWYLLSALKSKYKPTNSSSINCIWKKRKPFKGFYFKFILVIIKRKAVWQTTN